MSVIERIEKLRKEKGISRRKLAIMANIPPSTYQSAVERGRGLDLDALFRISDVLDVGVDVLNGFEREEIIEPTPKELQKQWEDFEERAYYEYMSMIDSGRIDALHTLLQHFDKLNAQGKHKAIERVQELTEIPKYQAKKQQ